MRANSVTKEPKIKQFWADNKARGLSDQIRVYRVLYEQNTSDSIDGTRIIDSLNRKRRLKRRTRVLGVYAVRHNL